MSPKLTRSIQPLFSKVWCGVIAILLLLVAGCGERATPTPLPALVPTATTTIAEPVADETAIPAPTNDQLVVWLPSFTGIASEGSGGMILTNAFHQFEQRHPSVKLDIEVKADTGTASLFNFLRSAQEVAPTILPDLILLNTQQLWQIADLGMVVALTEDELVAEDEFYPAANNAVIYRTQMIGIPYAVDVIHLAYDSEVNGEPPSSWDEVLAGDSSFLYPAAELGTVNATLLHYVGAGGELLEDGTISDPEALEEFFTFVAEGREANIIPAKVLELLGFNSTWREFAEDHSTLAAVQVMQFYPNATGIKPPSYAVMPTKSGEQITVTDTWAFAILTADEQRRQLALSLVNELLTPEVQGPWSQAIARLPSRPVSLEMWTQPNEYRDFVAGLLEVAIVPPNGPAFADFARRLQSAQAGIIRGELTVEAALDSMVMIE